MCKDVLRSFTPCSRREIEIVRPQINSASTCNTMSSDLLSHLFQRPEAESAHIEAKQCGQKVKYPSLRQKRQTTDNRSSLWRTSQATNHHFSRKLRHGRFFQFPSKSRGVVYILSIKAHSDKNLSKIMTLKSLCDSE